MFNNIFAFKLLLYNLIIKGWIISKIPLKPYKNDLKNSNVNVRRNASKVYSPINKVGRYWLWRILNICSGMVLGYLNLRLRLTAIFFSFPIPSNTNFPKFRWCRRKLFYTKYNLNCLHSTFFLLYIKIKAKIWVLCFVIKQFYGSLIYPYTSECNY